MKLANHPTLPAFEYFVRRRGRRWLWSLHTAEGVQVMMGSARNRSTAVYQANRALFQLLLSAPYRLAAQVHQQGPRPPLTPKL
jgi:hypothetical protein